MKKILYALSVCMVLMFGVPVLAIAQVTEAAIQAEGTGVTREQAVQSALVSAAGQAFGVQLNSNSVFVSSNTDVAVDSEQNNIMLNSLNKVVQQELNTPYNAPILGYDIISADKYSDNEWEAVVSLRYAKYERIGADSNRRSVVVVTNDKRHKELITNLVSESIIASRRFDVLNRQHQDLFNQETNFILGGDASVTELSRLSQATGADYLVLVELQNLGISNNMRETIKLSGEVIVRSAISGTLRLQVMEFASRKIKWSESRKFGATYEGVSSIGNQTLSKHITDSANYLVDKMVAAIYPIRIVKVMGDSAIINRGEGSVKAGDVFAIFQLGEELIDPESGESLGSMEVEMGLGQVTEVKPKFSFIKLESTNLADGENYVLRNTDKKVKNQNVPKTNTSKSSKSTKPATPSRKDIFLNN